MLVLGASTGLFGAVWAQAELRKVLNHLKAKVLDSEFPVGQAHEAFGEAELVEHTAGAELERQLAGLVELARDPAAEPSPPSQAWSNCSGYSRIAIRNQMSSAALEKLVDLLAVTTIVVRVRGRKNIALL